jgi:hypothetical protein
MAKPKANKKLAPAAPAPPPTTKVLPMQLKPGDRLTDSTGEWEVVARPFTTAGGKNAHARLRKVSQPELTDIRTWGAHEKVSVKRASAEKGKR